MSEGTRVSSCEELTEPVLTRDWPDIIDESPLISSSDQSDQLDEEQVSEYEEISEYSYSEESDYGEELQKKQEKGESEDETSDDADEEYDEDVDREDEEEENTQSNEEESEGSHQIDITLEQEEVKEEEDSEEKEEEEEEEGREERGRSLTSSKKNEKGEEKAVPVLPSNISTLLMETEDLSKSLSPESPTSPKRSLSRSDRLIGARTTFLAESSPSSSPRRPKSPTTTTTTTITTMSISGSSRNSASVRGRPPSARSHRGPDAEARTVSPSVRPRAEGVMPSPPATRRGPCLGPGFEHQNKHMPRSVSVFTPKKATNQAAKPIFLVGTGRQKAASSGSGAVPSPSSGSGHHRTKTQPTLPTFWRSIESYSEEDHKAAVCIQRLYHTRLQRKTYLRLRSHNRHRVRVIEELIATEKSYLRGLDVMEAYRNHFKTDLLNCTQKYLSAEDINHIFLNSVQIRDLNGRLLLELEDRVSRIGQTLVGQLFCDYAPYFKSYTDYCRGYEAAIQCLRQRRMVNQVAFDAYILDTQRRIGNDGGLPLASLHITPVQRIPRYVLLLKDLLEHTWEDHDDRVPITRALVKLEEIANVVNAGVSFGESALKVLSILHQLTGVPDAAEFVTPSRVFVREGIVQFCNLNAGKRGEFKDHLLYLFNDALVFARLIGFRHRPTTTAADDQRLLEKTRKQYRGMIKMAPGLVFFRPLEGNDCDVREEDTADYEEIGVTNAFYVQTSKRTFVVKCLSPQARTEWLRSFETVMLKVASQINQRTAPISRSTTVGCPESSPYNAPVNTITPSSSAASLHPQPLHLDQNTLSASMPLLQGTPGQGGIPSAMIIDAVTKNKKGKEHIAYVLHVVMPHTSGEALENRKNVNIIVYRRFREFEALKKTLERKFGIILSQLPAKHYFRNLSKEVISSRRVMLQGFLFELLADPELRKCHEFVQFLTSSTSE
eukprot:TRINITY_DN2019_c0_g1_i1.p1 TRINITY_DN2019_c0_g1~~TRINITY_DN2019_c0_g1_i1.p1  ORF type:complete len:948 (-),score=186.68 TRINITY_DN2019_c0_g1_i1:30-2873(-)